MVSMVESSLASDNPEQRRQKRDVKADTDHQALTHIANQLDKLVGEEK
jgi:hypothetical protein